MKSLILILFFCFPFQAFAITYHCQTTKKVERSIDYTLDKLKKYQFTTILDIYPEDVIYISRCGYSDIDKKIICNKYPADKIERDNNVNLIKVYIFKSQYNFQLFPDLTSVEDNGRGSISYQKCKVKTFPMLIKPVH